jgi:RNA polymerase sigma factor (sigma-70 family)
MSTADIAPEEPWLTALKAGDSDAAWDLFIAQYRRLIFATIRHYTRDHDEVMDAFADVCSALRHNQLARLQRYWDRSTHTARFSSWLVTVVRHQVIDWLRQHAVRRHPRFRGALSGLQRQIFEYVFVQHRSHVETYELLRATSEPGLSFGHFARELRATYQAIDAARGTAVAREIAGPVLLAVNDGIADIGADDVTDPAVILDTRLRITSALGSLAPDERLAVEMFVIHEMPAAAIARALRWPNAKAVYNRVYRALAALRARLERQGIRRDDL